MFRGRLVPLALLASIPLLASAAPPGLQDERRTLQPWEYAGLQTELNRVRMLGQRLSKQNALYQLNLAEQRKGDLVVTARVIDTALVSLREGQPARAIPVPPTPALRTSIEKLDSAWGPLRQLAVASPFDYKRDVTATGGDPLLLDHFDRLVAGFDTRAVEASRAYVVECKRVGIPDCEAVAAATSSGMLSERLVKETALVKAGLDLETNSARLRKSRETMGQLLLLAESLEPVQSAMSPERGRIGYVVREVWSDIGGNWDRLRSDVDLVLAGEADRVDLHRTAALQSELLIDMQRFNLAVRRFAAERRALGGGPPVAGIGVPAVGAGPP